MKLLSLLALTLVVVVTMMFKDVEGYTGSACIRNCTNKAEGDYQSCQGCHVYASCTTAGLLSDNRPWPADLVWNDNKKVCDWTSSTCNRNDE
ncbi:hypothetical protein LSAT2_015374 [Lamellibrachia satsuma]|nr:hypothetical protein LSAT2_015374 [Lamellibrachia satsuma]